MSTRPPLISRVDPLGPLTVVLTISIAVFFVLDPLVALILYLLTVLGVELTARLSVRQLLTAHLAFGSFALGVLLVNSVTRPGAVLIDLGVVRITDSGTSVGTALALRVLLIGLLSTALAVRVDPVRLIRSLQRHLGLSRPFSFAVLAGHRLLAGLPAEWRSLRAAQQSRAPLSRRGRPRSGPRAWCRAAFGLLVITIRRGERIAGSLEARGLGTAPGSWAPPPPAAGSGPASGFPQ